MNQQITKPCPCDVELIDLDHDFCARCKAMPQTEQGNFDHATGCTNCSTTRLTGRVRALTVACPCYGAAVGDLCSRCYAFGSHSKVCTICQGSGTVPRWADMFVDCDSVTHDPPTQFGLHSQYYDSDGKCLKCHGTRRVAQDMRDEAVEDELYAIWNRDNESLEVAYAVVRMVVAPNPREARRRALMLLRLEVTG